MGIEEALEVLKQYHEDIDAGLEPTGRNLGNFGFSQAVHSLLALPSQSFCLLKHSAHSSILLAFNCFFLSSDIHSGEATVNVCAIHPLLSL